MATRSGTGAANGAPSPTASGGLHEDRIADLPRSSARFFGVANGLGSPQNGNARFFGRPAGAHLVTGEREDLGRWTDKRQAGFGTCPRESGALGEEAVAWVDGIGSYPDCGLHERVYIQVSADRVTGFPDLVRLVRLLAVHGAAVLGRVNGDRADAELVGRPESADGDLTPIRDEHLLKHHISSPFVLQLTLALPPSVYPR